MLQALVLFATCAAGPKVEVDSLAGPTSGELVSIDRNQVVLAGGGQVPRADWCGLRLAEVNLPDFPTTAHIELVSGDRLAGSLVSSDGNSVRWKMSFGAEVRLPSSAVRVIWLRPREGPTDWLDRLKGRDLVTTIDGEQATGVLTAIDPTAGRLTMQVNGKETSIDWKRTSAIAFNPDLARPRRPKGAYDRLTLADGSRWSVGSASFANNRWTIATLYQESIQCEASQVVAIDVEQGKAVWLADLKPSAFEHRSFDGEKHMWQAHRNVLGNPLRLANGTFDRGLGLQAECTITYTLAGKYRQFDAWAGLDMVDGARGHAVLLVTADGNRRELSNNGELRVDQPLRLRVDVAGVKQLTIQVQAGKGGIVQDRVNLAQARLLP